MDNTYELQLTSDTGVDISNGKKSHILFNLQNPIKLKRSRCSVALTGGIIPRSFYAVSSLNDTFIVNVDGVVSTCTITPGSYNAIQLVDEAIKVLDIATGLAWTGAYDIISNKIKFVVTSAAAAISFTFLGTCSELFGFSSGTYDGVEDGGVFTFLSDLVVNVNGVLSVDIRVDGVSFIDALNPQGSTNILKRIYFYSGFNSLEVFQSNGFMDWKTATTSGKSISALGINITDKLGRNIDFNGVDWELSLYVRVF